MGEFPPKKVPKIGDISMPIKHFSKPLKRKEPHGSLVLMLLTKLYAQNPVKRKCSIFF
jgi:hypothetical protein